jgi:tetratricopeptide (TPR) repeat protein
MELNPGDVYGRHWYAHYLEVVGELPRAHTEMRKIADLDPVSEMYIADLAIEYYFMHQPHKVVEMSRAWSRSTTDPLSWSALALAYEQLGEKGESAKTAERAVSSDDSGFTSGYMALLLARLGNRERAQELLQQLRRRAQTEYIPPFALAMASFGLGDETSAYEHLRDAYEQRSPNIVLILLTDPQFDRYRSDPRFVALAQRYGVPIKAGGSPR